MAPPKSGWKVGRDDRLPQKYARKADQLKRAPSKNPALAI
jgi:hypothetical protein